MRTGRLLKRALLVLVFGFLWTPAQAKEAKYYVPTGQLSAAFQVMDQGYTNLLGMFQNATGAFAFDPETSTISQVKIAVDTSMILGPNQSALYEFSKLLETRRYGEISFMATAPSKFDGGKAQIKGTLRVHGQSKPAMFEGTLNNVGKGDDEESVMGLSLKGSFNRSDFGMADEPEIPSRFGEAVTLLLEAQAIRQ